MSNLPGYVACLMCFACAAPIEPTPRNPRLELPDRFAAPADANRVRDAWWTDFDDPELVELIESAFANNRDLGAAAARVATALALANAAGADLGPQWNATLDATRSRQVFVGFPIPGSSGPLTSTSSNFGLGLSLSWEIDLWGRLRAGELRAGHELEAAAADLRGARLSLAAQTAKTWFAFVEAKAQVALAERSAQLFEQSAERIERRFERGVRSSLDLRLARTEHANAEASLAQRRDALARTARALQVLVGRYPDGTVEANTELPRLPASVPAGVPADVLGRRPDLVAAERRLAAADAALGAARAAKYPAISLTANGGTRSDDVADLLDGDFRVWSLAGNVLAPIVDWGRRQAQVDLADARRHEAFAAWAGSVLHALSEVETHLDAEHQLRDVERHFARARDEAAAARSLSEDRYSRGLIDVVTLLTAQRRDVEAQRQHLAVHRQQLENRIDLLLALGGGIPLTPPAAEDTDS